MEQPQESGAEAKAQRLRGLRLEGQRGVVQLQFIERVAQVAVVVGVHGIDSGEDHRLGVTVAGQRVGGRSGWVRNGVAHAAVMHRLQAGGNIPHFAGAQAGYGFHARRKDADFHRLHVHAGRHHAQRLARLDLAFHHAHIGDHALVGIVVRVEHQRAQGGLALVGWRRDFLDDGLQDGFDVQPGLGRDAQHRFGLYPQQAADIFGHFVGTGGRQVNLIDDRDDGQVGFDGLVEICQCLRLNALGSVHYQHSPFAGIERAADLVPEIYVAGGVYQVQLVFIAIFGFVGHTHSRGFDGDAFFAFQVHRVQHLLGHLAVRDGAGQLQQAVGQRGFAVVYMRNDAEVTDVGSHSKRGEVYPIFACPTLCLLLRFERRRSPPWSVYASRRMFLDIRLPAAHRRGWPAAWLPRQGSEAHCAIE